MKYILINGSPKAADSASGCVLNYIGKALEEPSVIGETRDGKNKIPELNCTDVMILAFPLYVDGLPGHLLGYLEELKQEIKNYNSKIRFYAIANCGFYEAHQCETAMSILKSWCRQTGLQWGQALCIGGGGMMLSAPLGTGPMTSIGKGIDSFVREVKTGETNHTVVHLHPDFARRLYIAAAHFGWKSEGRKNGLKSRQLRKGLEPGTQGQRVIKKNSRKI